MESRRIALIACSSSKAPAEEEARRLYQGTLFHKSVMFAEKTCNEWAVLSAKYGLVRPNERIQPYDETLNTKTRADRLNWAGRVVESIRAEWNCIPCVFVFLAGAKYREGVLEALSAIPDVSVEVPMQGLGIGRQLQWLSARCN